MQEAQYNEESNLLGHPIARVAGGKIVEIWSQPDTLGLLQQLGVIPAPK
jgi:hypothetical protein